MSPDSQRIAIAEACGWRDIKHTDHEDVDIGSRSIIYSSGLTGVPPEFIHQENRLIIPDYLNDLNAMYVVEYKLLSGKIYELYYNQIAKLSPPCDSNTAQFAAFAVCNSTAAQRAKAFLRTLGKWEDDK